MKLSTTGFFSLVAVLGTITAVSSCSKYDRFSGTWQSTPERLTSIPDAADATSTMTIDFAPDVRDTKQGVADFSAVIEITKALPASPDILDSPYETNITATASINARYVFEKGDDDDIILSFDPSTLKVNVDPAGVTFSENMLSQTERPVIDSLTTAVADEWRVTITAAIREEFMKYKKIEDIKVHHGDMMSCEVEHRDLTFRRVGVPE